MAAFSEEHTAKLAGVSVGQLRAWDRSDFFKPSYAEENRRLAYSRVYSFRDVVSLRVIARLLNEHDVSLQHLRKVSAKLAGLSSEKWSAQKLYVHNRKVAFDEPETKRRREIVSGQFVIPLEIKIKAIVGEVEDGARTLMSRRRDQIGQFERNRWVAHNAEVFAGTRIAVDSVRRFAEDGYSIADIRKEYPSLTAADVKAALSRQGRDRAA